LDARCGFLFPNLKPGTKRERSDEAHWTAGGDQTLAHHRRIDGGAAGDVHEVSSSGLQMD
jgi:hypothetical protein